MQAAKAAACNAFTPDTCVFYTADYADFDTSALRSHRVNTLVATTLYDSVGNVVEPNETMIAMMHAAADQIDHAIFDFQIIVVNGQRYFAFVKLNVNWWDPCTLYEYEGGELRELRAVGQHAPAVDRFHMKKAAVSDRDSRFSFFTCFSPSCTGPVPRRIRRSSPR